ncbi:MAG: hypothetical protein KBF84_05695 [Candidatus Microthrix sp.]|uniref:Antitoxin FitA-like ribbon-helix-helix domain-containing protein n=1 Tax=Candidatus Neomicrothrix subdominans TaxID=2954438 RepID=A0A936N9T1_9ACTN|nr:hypothetical protein [Candidatus Microthrix sp.]MBK6968369.1 hypothetical protein [Candidatus Microthrix sp.]MBK9296050.1 hypothetical protein [Candidatus Microthrix subdominans]MBP9065560.1 hypothetical protein [Candidatus Microthrix sp.]
MQAMANVLIRDLPDDVHRELRRRAEASGQSLQSYLSMQLARVVERPTSDELLERVARRASGRIGLEEAVADLRVIRAER